MTDDFMLEQDPINCGLSEIMSLETPSSSSNYSVGEPNNIGLPYQNEPITGGSIIQSSPPHYRHSRAYRHFKNPPQPHMCIRTTTEHGEELFINVLSWTRIVIPQEASDPIPLYGGMRVPPGSPRSPPVVFAVMANPEVLKDSGRHSKDPEERRAMVELMCDFVEAMNPGVKLVRNAVILKDRDISGELKDVWNAVQAQRDREREEQMIQQRQQQHYHNTTTQQLFPKIQNNPLDETQTEAQVSSTNSNGPDSKIVFMEIGSDQTRVLKNDQSNDSPIKKATEESSLVVTAAESAITRDEEDGQVSNKTPEKEDSKNQQQSTEPSEQGALEPALTQVNNMHNSKLCSIANTDNITTTKPNTITNGGNKKSSNSDANPSSTTTTTTTTTTAKPTSAPPKKEKLGGFLPNGCIFPRFKNNKHKDKDKDTSKSTSKDREKNLLHVLKKNKDKQEDPNKTQYEKNCINLESEVEKLDLNKIDTASSNDNMFMKLKVATSAAK